MSRSQKSLALAFSLRLPQTLGKLALPPIATPLSVPPSPFASALPQPVEKLAFTLGKLTDDILTGMDTDEVLKLVINARDTITTSSSPLIQPISPSNIFSTPQSLPTLAISHSLTPKMDRVRSVATSTEVMTYTGSLDFLDSQDIFDVVFGNDPSMLTLIPRKKGQCATKNTDYLIQERNEFCNLCRLHIFCDSVQLKYVGTDIYDSQKMLADISLAVSKLRMFYSVRGRRISLTPDDLFSHFTAFLPLLSPNAMSWSFCLVTLFFQALPTELQEAVQLGGYIFPDISKLTTSLLQEQSLQSLREHAVVAYKKLTDESRRIRRIMSTMSSDRGWHF